MPKLAVSSVQSGAGESLSKERKNKEHQHGASSPILLSGILFV